MSADAVAAQHCAIEKTLAAGSAPRCTELQGRFGAVDGRLRAPILRGMNQRSTPFSEELRIALQVAAMTQSELGRRVGRSGAAVNQWLSGKDTPAVDILLKVEKALDLPLGHLTRLVGTPLVAVDWGPLSWRQTILQGLSATPLAGADRRLIMNLIDRLVSARSDGLERSDG